MNEHNYDLFGSTDTANCCTEPITCISKGFCTGCPEFWIRATGTMGDVLDFLRLLRDVFSDVLFLEINGGAFKISSTLATKIKMLINNHTIGQAYKMNHLQICCIYA